ncbi:MAG TPA: hypothetical protein VKZ39_01160 [Sphaerochaetaceae bacterium]|nr:hypothetical protein [Sphaerochaetaceae bacterium]
MKTLLKILLLVLFAVVIFMPSNQIALWAYWSLFLFMFVVLYLYYRSSYWVSDSDVSTVYDGPIKFSVFAGKVPPMTSEDLVRGRLVVTERSVDLYQRYRNRNNGQRARLVWSVDIESIEGFTIGRVVGFRGGVTFSIADKDDARFTIFFMKSKKEALTKALGWDED